MKKKIIFTLVIIIVTILLLLLVLLGIDYIRIQEGKPVLFSTFGSPYTPPQYEEILPTTTAIITPSSHSDYDYSVYLYMIQEVSFTYQNSVIDLKQALSSNQITMENLFKQLEQDVIDKKATKEIYTKEVYGKDNYTNSTSQKGTAIKYIYQDYSFIKFNNYDGNNNFFIGNNSMQLEKSHELEYLK